MFLDANVETKPHTVLWLEGLTRRHPRGFIAVLVFLMVGITLGLLFNTSPPIILYQGF